MAINWNVLKEHMLEVIKEDAFEMPGGNKVISMFELASHLNNCWYAPEFLPKSQHNKLWSVSKDSSLLAIEEHNLSLMFRRIRTTAKRFPCFNVIRQGKREKEFVFYDPILD